MIAAASMWTQKGIKEFKDSIRKDVESVVKVGSGETVTVSSPLLLILRHTETFLVHLLYQALYSGNTFLNAFII